MAKPSPSQPEPVILRENSIIDGVFYLAGEPLPFAREEDLPPNLKGLVATGDEEFYSHAERKYLFRLTRRARAGAENPGQHFIARRG